MTESQAYVAFNLTDHIGSARLAPLVASAGSVADAWQAYPKKISRTGAEVNVEREYALAEKYGIKIVTPADEDYPARLKDVAGFPLALYVKGDVSQLSKPMVAIVGTRRASQYGLSVAASLASDLASAGWCIVSGLALGIDAAGHRGALDAQGSTVGVLGSALDQFYPEQNRLLAKEIIEKSGAVVSQFAFGRHADTVTFPIRNHVVAALASGVVAVECSRKSGTLITTTIAGELGRPVMAVPGSIDSKTSFGCNSLIRNGAILVRNADDVIETLTPFSTGKKKGDDSKEAETEKFSDPLTPPYTTEEALVMLHVDETGVSIDELVMKTHLSVQEVSRIAMSLRMKGFARFLPGNRIATMR
jgi:DNA processing protein